MTLTIALSQFKGCSFLNNVANRIDDNGDFNEELNGEEISLFTKELDKKGITLDFSKLNNATYLREIDAQYNNRLNEKFKENKMASVLIDKYKDKYDIKEYKEMNAKGSYESYYLITPKVSVKPADVRSDLRIAEGVISANNGGFGQYDNGTHVENKVIDKPIKVPASALGAERGLLDKLFGI